MSIYLATSTFISEPSQGLTTNLMTGFPVGDVFSGESIRRGADALLIAVAVGEVVSLFRALQLTPSRHKVHKSAANFFKFR